MLPIHTILHPTDFSDCSRAAFQLACSLARDYQARILVVHVAAPPMPMYGKGLVLSEGNEIEQELTREALRKVKPDDPAVRIERQLIEGDPATEILAAAAGNRADLIVMGTHGRTALGRLLMGSVASPVVRKAACPVLTLRVPLPEIDPNAEPRPPASHEG